MEAAVAAANQASVVAFKDPAEADVVVAVGDHWLVRLTDIGSIDARRSWLETYAEKLPAGALFRPRPDHGPESLLKRRVASTAVTAFTAARPGAADRLAAALRRAYALPAATA